MSLYIGANKRTPYKVLKKAVQQGRSSEADPRSRFTPHVSRFLGAMRERRWRAFSASCWLHRLLMPQHGQRPLAENPVGARKTHDQRQQHRQEEAAAKHPWVHAPGKIEHIPQRGP